MTRDERIQLIRIKREKERRKCQRSFSRFVESWCWIEGKQEGAAVPFKLWPAQLRILPDFLAAGLLLVLKARQLGLTWLTAAYCLWLCVFFPMKLVVVVSAKEEWAVEFLDRVRFMKNRLPVWLVPDLDKDGAQHMRFVHEWTPAGRKAKVYSEIKSLATTVEGAQGKTPDVLVMDETARNRYAKQIYAMSKPGIDKAGGRIIVISNSHKDGVGWSWTRSMCAKARKGALNAKLIFMPWWDCPERLSPAEAARMAQDPDFRPTAFRVAQLQELDDEEDFIQNYPETLDEALSPMLGSYFGKTLGRHVHTMPGLTGWLQRDRAGSLAFVPDDAGIYEFWRFPYHRLDGWDGLHWSRRYAIGSDVSEGLGLSYSVAYVEDRLMDEMVCRVRSNRLDAVEWAKALHELSEFYGGAVICPERTGAGQTTVKELVKVNANVYFKERFDRAGGQMTKEFGWSETPENRHILCGDLKHWFRTMRGTLYCGLLVDEASTFVRTDSGKLDHEEGHFSDCVMAAGCTRQASLSLGGPPEKEKPKQEGWLKRWRKEGEGAWVA